MGIFIHSLDMLENTYIQSFNHYSKITYNKNPSSNIKSTHPNFFLLP